MGKLQSWSIFFTPYFNLVPNISIVSIWSLTFSMLCQFSLPIPWMKKADVLNKTIKKIFFMPHQLVIVPPH